MKIINLEKSKEAILEDMCNFLTNAQTTSPCVLACGIMSVLEKYSVSSLSPDDKLVEMPCMIGDTIYEIVERKREGKWIPVVVERRKNRSHNRTSLREFS